MTTRTSCTCRREDGVTPCGEVDDCTRVEIRSGADDVLVFRYACGACRKRMRLPEYDVVFDPTHTDGRPA